MTTKNNFIGSDPNQESNGFGGNIRGANTVAFVSFQRTRITPYNQVSRRDNFFTRPLESPIVTAANQIVRGGNSGGLGGGFSSNNLPTLAKQNTLVGSANETKDSINAGQENTRRSSQGFAIKRPKMGDLDFDYNTLNMNLR